MTPHAWEWTFRITEMVGGFMWLPVYVLAYRKARRDRTYGIPVAAICSNFGWEFVFLVIFPQPGIVPLIVGVGWLGLDAFIVFQLLQYGPGEQKNPELRRHFRAFVIAGCVLSGLFHWQFAVYYRESGMELAYLANLLMSILFVGLYFDRPDLRGLSYSAAWLKMFGTVLTMVGPFAFVHERNPDRTSWGFWYVLLPSIVVFDVLYVVLLTNRRRALRLAASDARQVAVESGAPQLPGIRAA